MTARAIKILMNHTCVHKNMRTRLYVHVLMHRKSHTWMYARINWPSDANSWVLAISHAHTSHHTYMCTHVAQKQTVGKRKVKNAPQLINTCY